MPEIVTLITSYATWIWNISCSFNGNVPLAYGRESSMYSLSHYNRVDEK